MHNTTCPCYTHFLGLSKDYLSRTRIKFLLTFACFSFIYFCLAYSRLLTPRYTWKSPLPAPALDPVDDKYSHFTNTILNYLINIIMVFVNLWLQGPTRFFCLFVFRSFGLFVCLLSLVMYWDTSPSATKKNIASKLAINLWWENALATGGANQVKQHMKYTILHTIYCNFWVILISATLLCNCATFT